MKGIPLSYLLIILGLGVFFYLIQRPNSSYPTSFEHTPAQKTRSTADGWAILSNPQSITQDQLGALIRLWRHEDPAQGARLDEATLTFLAKSFLPSERDGLLRSFFEQAHLFKRSTYFLETLIGVQDNAELEMSRLLSLFKISPKNTLPQIEVKITKLNRNSELRLKSISRIVDASTKRDTYKKELSAATGNQSLPAILRAQLYLRLIGLAQDKSELTQLLSDIKETVLSPNEPEELRVRLLRVASKRKDFQFDEAEFFSVFNAISFEQKQQLIRVVPSLCALPRQAMLDTILQDQSARILNSVDTVRDEILRRDPCKLD